MWLCRGNGNRTYFGPLGVVQVGVFGALWRGLHLPLLQKENVKKGSREVKEKHKGKGDGEEEKKSGEENNLKTEGFALALFCFSLGTVKDKYVKPSLAFIPFAMLPFSPFRFPHQYALPACLQSHSVHVPALTNYIPVSLSKYP